MPVDRDSSIGWEDSGKPRFVPIVPIVACTLELLTFVGSILLSAIAIVVAGLLLYLSERKRAAVGRR